jgi:hypothetical protein
MKKLLLSVFALMFATLMFSLDNNDIEEKAIDTNLSSVEQQLDLNA